MSISAATPCRSTRSNAWADSMDDTAGKNAPLAGIPEEIRDVVCSFTDGVRRTFPGSRVYLFGSYAKRTFHRNSDIDVAVFLPDVCGNGTLVSAFRKICALLDCCDYDIQPQVFSLEEFDHPSGIVEEIARWGIDLTARMRENRMEKRVCPESGNRC